MRKLSKRELNEVNNIVEKWRAEINQPHHTSQFTGKKVHPYPSYFYRLNGTWKGWNILLGTPKNSFQYKIHERLEVLEDLAFKIINS